MTIDFGNSLPIKKDGSFNVDYMGKLMVALPTNKDPNLNCLDTLQYLGMIGNKNDSWYESSAGIQVFPVAQMTDDQVQRIRTTPLVVAEVNFRVSFFKSPRKGRIGTESVWRAGRLHFQLYFKYPRAVYVFFSFIVSCM